MPLKIFNRMAMIGVLPSKGAYPIPVGFIPDDGIEVFESAYTQGATATVYTVPTDRFFYASLIALSSRNQGASDGYVNMSIHDSGGGLYRQLITFNVPLNDGKGLALPFFPPLKIQSSYSIRIVSEIANLWVFGLVHGYTLSAI